MVRSPRDYDRKVWGNRAHEFIAGWADSDLCDVGKVVVMPWAILTQCTRRVISMFQPCQQRLGLLCFGKDDFLRDDTPRFSIVVLAPNYSAEPLDCLSEGLNGQLAGHWIGCNRILERRGVR